VRGAEIREMPSFLVHCTIVPGVDLFARLGPSRTTRENGENRPIFR
jgi:hypothetical protein